MNAKTYAARTTGGVSPQLEAFLNALEPGARVLELGCGGGRDAAHMLARGFDVVPTDGSPALAALAARRLGRNVPVMLFDDLEAVGAFDGVWANACLLHVRAAELPAVLARVHRALRPGGRFDASYKGGAGEGRDSLGRYYNFPTCKALAAAYAAAGPWASMRIEMQDGGGYDGVRRVWLLASAVAVG